VKQGKLKIILLLLLISCLFFSCVSNQNTSIDRKISADNPYKDLNQEELDSKITHMYSIRQDLIWLLECGADINAGRNEGCTALGQAAWHGLYETVAFLLENGADVNIQSNCASGYRDWTPLIWAVKGGHIEVVRLLLENGADVNLAGIFCTIGGHTALMEAVENSHTELVKILIEYGADIHAENSYGKTPLMNAIYRGNIDIVNLLISCGANINHRSHSGLTPLMIAATYGYTEIAEILLSKGAKINEKDNFGSTALMMAAQYGNTETTALLISQGADMNAEYGYGINAGQTAFILSAFSSKPELIDLFLSRGIDINSKGGNGWTILNGAACHGNTETILFLLKRGADINGGGYGGLTALMMASRFGNLDIARLLIENGADVNQESITGWTAYIWAEWTGNTEVADFLASSGADTNRKYSDVLRKDVSLYKSRDLEPVVTNIPEELMEKVCENVIYLNELVEHLLSGIDDPFLKVKVIHDWIVYKISYDSESSSLIKSGEPHNPTNLLIMQSVEAVLESGKAVCEGYSNLFYSMCSYAGIECVFITGDTAFGAHAWNAVFLEGNYYLVDVTWDDHRVTEQNESNEEYAGQYSTTYLFADPISMSYNHIPYSEQWTLLD
jgi:ankyrin repeat protein